MLPTKVIYVDDMIVCNKYMRLDSLFTSQNSGSHSCKMKTKLYSQDFEMLFARNHDGVQRHKNDKTRACSFVIAISKNSCVLLDS